MRALILAFFVLVIVAGVPSADAGLSTAVRETSTSVETVTDEAISNQQTEDQIGLTKVERRDLQRRLTKLGFGTKISGEFDDSTRAAIARWQERNGLPKTGFLDPVQHEMLLSESASATDAGKSSRGRARARPPGGGPIGAVGSAVGGVVGGVVHGVVGGIFRR
jgi:peptidoglycan hydrolase-like protein with peptidoglycan-binding domain